MNMKLFIQFIGGHACGKSSVAGWLKKEYPKGIIEVLGTYKKSKTSNYQTGGLDPLRLTNKERYEMIEASWKTNTPVIVAEGMIISYYKSFLEKYYKLQETHPRKVYIYLLNTSIMKMVERFKIRSNGKEMSKKRYDNLIGKKQTAIALFKRLRETENYRKKSIDTNNDMDEIKTELKAIIKENI